MKRYFIALTLLCLATGCSAQTVANSERVNRALSLMVIDSSQFDRNFMNPCDDMQQCQAPLVCMHSHCQIPPSLLNEPESDTPQLTIINGDAQHKLFVEICNDRYTQTRGMMMRKAFADGWAMLFAFTDDSKRHFWMKNTYIPLDMVFVRKDGSVSNVIENARPLDEGPRYESTDRVRYVIELPVGSIQKYGITPSSKVVVPEN